MLCVGMLRVWSPAADVERKYRIEGRREGLYSWAVPLIVDEKEGAAHEVGRSLLHRVIKSLW